MANKKSKKIGIYDSCINEYVYNEVPEGPHCLDVGCWTSNLGKKLIKSKKCSVDRINFMPAVLAKALYNRCDFEIKAFYGYSLVKNKFFFPRYLAKWWPKSFVFNFWLF